MTCESVYCGRDDPASAFVVCHTSLGLFAFAKRVCRFHAKAWEIIAGQSNVSVRVYRRITK